MMTREQMQLAVKFDSARIVWPCAVEPKLDGIRATWVHGVGYRSREGNPLIGPTFNGPTNVVLDGELVGEDFQATCSAVRVGGALRFVVFDVIPLSEWTASVFVLPLARRLELRDLDLRRSWTETVCPIATTHVHSLPEFTLQHSRFIEAGYEGSMVKALAAPYTPGRSSFWMKLKPLDDLDVRVIGVKPGRGRLIGKVGALICELESGVRVEIGVGMSLMDRARWTAARVIGRRCEIAYQGLTRGGVPRFARFKRWRSDREASAHAEIGRVDCGDDAAVTPRTAEPQPIQRRADMAAREADLWAPDRGGVYRGAGRGLVLEVRVRELVRGGR